MTTNDIRRSNVSTFGMLSVWRRSVLNLWVPGLGFIEYLTDEIYWSLYLIDVVGLVALDHHGSGDHPISCRNVKQEGFVFSGSSEEPEVM